MLSDGGKGHGVSKVFKMKKKKNTLWHDFKGSIRPEKEDVLEHELNRVSHPVVSRGIYFKWRLTTGPGRSTSAVRTFNFDP